MERIGSKDFRPRTTAISKNSEEHSLQQEEKEAEIKKQITLLATARQTIALELTLRSYSKGLSGFDLRDVKSAVAEIGSQERPEGRTALPSLGEMVKACQHAAQRRHEANRQKREAEDYAYKQAHPEKFFSWKELVEDMQMQRDACEAAFGVAWRERPEYRPVYDAQGRWMRGGLGDVYAQAMEAA